MTEFVPTTTNRGHARVGDVIATWDTVVAVSVTAYKFAGMGWVSFDRVHGRPQAATPLALNLSAADVALAGRMTAAMPERPYWGGLD